MPPRGRSARILLHSGKIFYLVVLKFIYSEEAKIFCEISTLLLPYVVPVKSKVEILQNFVAFSEYMNFNIRCQEFLTQH